MIVTHSCGHQHSWLVVDPSPKTIAKPCPSCRDRQAGEEKLSHYDDHDLTDDEVRQVGRCNFCFSCGDKISGALSVGRDGKIVAVFHRRCLDAAVTYGGWREVGKRRD